MGRDREGWSCAWNHLLQFLQVPWKRAFLLFLHKKAIFHAECGFPSHFKLWRKGLMYLLTSCSLWRCVRFTLSVLFGGKIIFLSSFFQSQAWHFLWFEILIKSYCSAWKPSSYIKKIWRTCFERSVKQAAGHTAYIFQGRGRLSDVIFCWGPVTGNCLWYLLTPGVLLFLPEIQKRK